MTPQLTTAGRNLLMRALTGDTINFTKMQLGNGAAQMAATATALNNPILTVEFTDFEVGSSFVTLEANFTNETVDVGFRVTEIGYFATDPDDETKEILYAIGNEEESTADYVPASSDRILEMTQNNLIFIGDAENVTAAIAGSSVYALKEDLDNHEDDQNNPHGVTAAQVGAAATSHTHNATDINGGVLSQARGGTGASSLSAALRQQSSVVASFDKSSNISFGEHEMVGITPAGKIGHYTGGSLCLVGFAAKASNSEDVTVPVILSGVVDELVRVKTDNQAMSAGTRLYPHYDGTNGAYLSTTTATNLSRIIILQKDLPADHGTVVGFASVIIV